MMTTGVQEFHLLKLHENLTQGECVISRKHIKFNERRCDKFEWQCIVAFWRVQKEEWEASNVGIIL